jgi:tetratricopeptide (TPR) repeat protein
MAAAVWQRRLVIVSLRCPNCGGVHASGICPSDPDAFDVRVVRREVVGVIVLCVVVVAGFFLTRAAAAANRTLRADDAAAWHAIARVERTRGNPAAAVRALRRAVALNRERADYRLDLADALAARGEDEASRQVLLELRESAIDIPAVDIRLARLASRAGQIDDAVRAYQRALLGGWREEDEPARRRLRIEFIQYLLSHDRRGRALSELITASANVPDDSAAQSKVAGLLREAGDPVRALAMYRRALARDPGNATAAEGAGIASFESGDYAAARRYLRGLNRLSERGQTASRISELVLSRDPLRRGLDGDERRRRVITDLAAVLDRIGVCLARSTDSANRRDLETVRASARDLGAALATATRRTSRDDIERAFALVVSVERQTATCASSSPLDEALVIIARLHETDP